MHYTSGQASAVPNQPSTPNRNVRIDDDLWAEVERIAADQRLTPSEVVRIALRTYVRRYPA